MHNRRNSSKYRNGAYPGSLRGQKANNRRWFMFVPRKQRYIRWAAALFAVLFVVSAVNVVSYAFDYFRARQASAALREAYYADDETETMIPAELADETPAPSAAPVPTEAPEVTATPPVRLESVRYPENRNAEISKRFQKIRRANKDIIGWLSIDGLLDEAVVQRDNEYYLKRDYRGYHNVNGAIFLDEGCDLSTRPYTMLLYGHNMKTGAMFGNLRNYENLAYYKLHPFVTFDTAYEDGRYVIFMVGTISTRSSSWQFVDLSRLCSSMISYREEALKTLLRRSVYTSGIDVAADDQLLLMVTCVDDDTERRVIAARRIRTDETEEDLNEVVQRTRKK